MFLEASSFPSYPYKYTDQIDLFFYFFLLAFSSKLALEMRISSSFCWEMLKIVFNVDGQYYLSRS